ncbi:MAG TPA: hypothetical protein ENK47_03805 [Euryarchaeota archaeon]|nr:hypothetical protein [Euryarchaeota archaeon]
MTVDPVLLIVIPLAAAFLVPLTSLFSKAIARWIPLLGLLGMALVIGLDFGDLYDGAVTSTTGGFDPPWGISIVMTPFGGLLAAGMIGVALYVLLSGVGGRDGKNGVVYSTMVMMATTGGVGMVITGDLFNMFVFLEITSIAGVVLAAMPRDNDRKGLNWRGAAVYAVVGGVASFLVLAGIGLLYGATSTLNIAQMASRVGDMDAFVAGTAFLLMLIGFGIEAELFPLNGWAVEVYRGSRWGTSSIFSTVIGKAGLFALLRMSFIVIGPAIKGDFVMDILLWGGAATYLFGEAAAFTSRDMYRMLGYSSIGVFGLLTASFSIGTGDGVRAGVLLIIGHMLAKPLLFSMMAHAGRRYSGDVPLKALRGMIRSSPAGALMMTVGILALIGMPPSPTFWGKYFLFSGAGSSEQWVLVGILVVGTVIEAGYLGRLIFNIFDVRKDTRENGLPLARGIMGAVAVFMIFLIGVMPGPLHDIIELVIRELLQPLTYIRWGVI